MNQLVVWMCHLVATNDVAKLYNMETKVLNQTIKRNIKIFLKSFCFQLTNKKVENSSLRSQIATLNKSESRSKYSNNRFICKIKKYI